MASASKEGELYASGYTSYDNRYVISVSFTTSLDTANNRSSVYMTGSMWQSYIRWYSGTASTLSIKWYDDNQYQGGYTVASTNLTDQSYNAGYNNTIASLEGSFYVPHKADGTLNGYAVIEFIKGGSVAQTPQSGSVATDLTFLGVAFANPYWTQYTVSSFPAAAYANMPYTYNIALACNYGSSTSNNLLYWEGFYGSHGVVTVSTTEAAIGAGARTYTFGNGDIGTYNFRGVIRYTDAGGNLGYIAHTTTYPLTVSYLNPTLTAVSHKTNATNYYRTSTVTTTSSGTVAANSAAGNQRVFVYFDAEDAVGDGSGQGYYYIATNSFSGATASYVHNGTKSGTFTTHVVMNGPDAAGAWTNFGNGVNVTYTMQPFVIPTAPRTVVYNKNNVYVGQTKFPVTVQVSSVNKSQYDTLTPTFNLGTRKNGAWSYDTDALKHHTFTKGNYDYTLVKTTSPYVAGDKASFCDELVYVDANNAEKKVQVSTQEYIVKTMPAPTAEEVIVSISLSDITDEVTVGMQGNMDTDFRCYYTIYLEKEDGSVLYATFNDFITSNEYKEHKYDFNIDKTSTCRARVVCHYALEDETNIVGPDATFNSKTVEIYGGAKLYVKRGDNVSRFYLGDSRCKKPRLAIKNGENIFYLQLVLKEDNTRFDEDRLTIKNGSVVYQAIANLIPDSSSHRYLSQFTHDYLGDFTHKEIQDGEA